ncbi:MAG: HD domain-containing protein, partial [Thermus sp.]
MLPVPTFLRLIRAETLKELFEKTPRGVSSAFNAEGVYLLRLVGGRWRVVGAYGVGEKALGLRLPLEWVPPEGPIPLPGPLAFSPDGRERPGYGLKRGDFALLLEGVSSLDPDGEELLTVLLEVVVLRAQRLVSLQILDFILAFGKRLRMGGSLERELKEALTELLAHTGFGAGALFLREGEICRLLVVGGEFPPEYLLYHQRHSVGCREGAGRLLWESPDGVAVIPDYQEYPHALPEVKRMGLRTTVQLLLSWAGQPYGVLALGSFGQKVEMEPELKRLLLVARDELEAYLERRFQVEGTLEAIAAILERLDYETEGHMRRVSELAVLLGERVGVEDLEGLRMGAYLHDLGKL